MALLPFFLSQGVPGGGVRKDNWLEKSKFPMLEIVWFIYLWCLDIVSFVLVNREFGWSHHT